ncbi:hypothetical protein GCM10027613_39060 [Microlunatus endophyticus]
MRIKIIGPDRTARGQPMPLQVTKKAADIPAGEIRAQRPRRIHVADGHGEIRYAVEHQPAVDDPGRRINRHAVDAEIDPAQQLHPQPGGRDDHIGRQQLARCQPDAIGLEVIDVIGDDGRITALDRREKIPIGDDAQPLVPRVVQRCEVPGRIVGAEPADDRLAEHPAGRLGTASGDPVEHLPEGEMADAVDPMCETCGQSLPQPLGRRIVTRLGGDPGRRPLQHRHLCGDSGQCRDQGDRGRTGADHHHSPAGQVKIIRPMLRVHDGPREILPALEVGGVALGVVVVTRAGVEKATRPDLLAGGAGGCDGPALVGAGPVGCRHPGAETDPAIDAGFGGQVLQVAPDVGAVGERL